GQLRAMFVLTKDRQKLLPDVPSAPEVGLPEMVVTTWYGVLAPAGTPHAIIEKVAAAIDRGFSSDAQRKLAAGGINYAYQGPADFSTFIREDFETWEKVVKEANIPVQR